MNNSHEFLAKNGVIKLMIPDDDKAMNISLSGGKYDSAKRPPITCVDK